jgi:hypothetical protein
VKFSIWRSFAEDEAGVNSVPGTLDEDFQSAISDANTGVVDAMAMVPAAARLAGTWLP